MSIDWASTCGFMSFIPSAQVGAPGGADMKAYLFRKLVQRIREEFEEAPGLRITLSEGARFWALDLATCERVLGELLAAGFLALGADERYRQRTTLAYK